jgi:predicted MFS family arabinose efflux permease
MTISQMQDSSSPNPDKRERNIILLVGLMQFVNILDFMMVMPLGPDFAVALGIPTHDIGLIGGIYTFAAAISGLIAALFLDRYSRKSMVLLMLSGLVIATCAGALAWNTSSMLAIRMIAGIFGGPLMSLALALIADYVPPERRGRAMGKVSGAFAAGVRIGALVQLACAVSIYRSTRIFGITACATHFTLCSCSVREQNCADTYCPSGVDYSLKNIARHICIYGHFDDGRVYDHP